MTTNAINDDQEGDDDDQEGDDDQETAPAPAPALVQTPVWEHGFAVLKCMASERPTCRHEPGGSQAAPQQTTGSHAAPWHVTYSSPVNSLAVHKQLSSGCLAAHCE